MRNEAEVIVIGAGPGGQKAAVQAAKAGKKVVLIERDHGVGGACVYWGTIPSKTLRETALQLSQMRKGAAALRTELGGDTEVSSLMTRSQEVIDTHVDVQTRQIARNGIERVHGRARFLSDQDIEVEHVNGTKSLWRGDIIVIGTGSVPRKPDHIPIDHEHVLDSDSILSMFYLPESLIVLGGGVIATEYACIFAQLGVKVTLIDENERPLGFMDEELTAQLVSSLERQGATYMPRSKVKHVEWDGIGSVVATLVSGQEVRSQKLLVALGRVANLKGLDVQKAGLEVTSRGHLKVDANCRTNVPHIYAVGDVIGPPALAATSMEQGRRAISHAIGIISDYKIGPIPVGIFTIPEMGAVGLTEREARKRFADATIGIARFEEVARSRISGVSDGLLKLVADERGEQILGVHVVGNQAAELVHIGQMAMLADLPVVALVDSIFNFPTLAEAYRIAALDLINRRRNARKSAEDTAE